MKEDVILVGGFHESIELIEKCGLNLIGIVDHSPEMVLNSDYLYLGNDADFIESGEYKNVKVVVSPDVPSLRKKLSNCYLDAGYQLAIVMLGYVSTSSDIGNGVVVQDQAYISSMSSLGDGVKVNVGAKVMHDCVIGDYTTIAPSAVILGNVNIGNNCYIGANATVLPNVTIEDDVTVGAGAVVISDVSEGLTVKGVPAK